MIKGGTRGLDYSSYRVISHVMLGDLICSEHGFRYRTAEVKVLPCFLIHKGQRHLQNPDQMALKIWGAMEDLKWRQTARARSHDKSKQRVCAA